MSRAPVSGGIGPVAKPGERQFRLDTGASNGAAPEHSRTDASHRQVPLDAVALRRALGQFATGVTVVTAHAANGEDLGITANSFNSVSLDPPLVLWSLSRKARSLPLFTAADHFAVNILAVDQTELSDRFARAMGPKYDGVQVERGAGQTPLLCGCAARFQCRQSFRHEGGDHVIFVGEVIAFECFDREPLVYHAGRYAVASHHPNHRHGTTGA